MLTRQTLTGPWAGLPVAWTEDDRFDEETYRGDIARCCRAGMPGIYTGGTTGEFYAMELDEFKAVARATVAECHAHGKPAMIGVSSTYTLGEEYLRRVQRGSGGVERSPGQHDKGTTSGQPTGSETVMP